MHSFTRLADGDAYSQMLFAVCKQVNSPFSELVWALYQEGWHSALVDLSIDPEDYNDHLTFSKDYMVLGLVKKYTGLRTHLDLKKVALSGLDTSEARCRATNSFIRQVRTGEVSFLPHVDCVVFDAQRKIVQILGDWEEADLFNGVRAGPGSTSSLNAAKSLPDTKFSHKRPHVTRRAFAYYVRYGLDDTRVQLVGCPDPVVVAGGVITTVPKSAKTDRCIAKEPDWNVELQLSAGGFLRRRLALHGVNLNDQGPNQRAAARAQRDGLATIDLSSASDSIARELVYLLLPLDMAELLDDLRSWSAHFPDGSVRVNERFSSMGNGFTFELESLIFYALAISVVRRGSGRMGEVFVYGDDIIVPQEDALALIEVLTAVGFVTNNDKTFIRGRFFESCGKHYFDGHEVTPPYQEAVLSDDVECARCHNRLLEWGRRVYPTLVLSPTDGSGAEDIHPLQTVASLLPRVPTGFGFVNTTIRPAVLALRRHVTNFPEAPHLDAYGHPYDVDGALWVLPDTLLFPSTDRWVHRFSRMAFQPLELPGQPEALYGLWLRRRGQGSRPCPEAFGASLRRETAWMLPESDTPSSVPGYASHEVVTPRSRGVYARRKTSVNRGISHTLWSD